METKHHQLWTGTVQEILHLDSLGRILVQLIIIFQVIRVIISMSTENIYNCRLIVMREIKTGQLKKMLDTEKVRSFLTGTQQEQIQKNAGESES